LIGDDSAGVEKDSSSSRLEVNRREEIRAKGRILKKTPCKYAFSFTQKKVKTKENQNEKK
jgi:hypothetical protein